MNDNVDAARIVEVLNRHGVLYVVIGGYAAELHEVAGLPPTRDIDVCPSTDRENLERLSNGLKAVRLERPSVPGRFSAAFAVRGHATGASYEVPRSGCEPGPQR